MKINQIVAIAAASLFAFEAFAADVHKSAIKPAWSGAKIATWTMDYKTALEKASSEGKYTLMFFSGMWWCPHCQHFEENVLTTSEWKAFAKGNGFYETVIDFPNRAGDGYWCWLWDESFRKSAGLTAEDAAAAIVERYELQNYYSLPGGMHQVARNVVVQTVGKGQTAEVVMTDYAAQPTSEYTRIGYPTILIIDPFGKVLGRFSPSKNNPTYMEDPLQWVKNQINSIIHPDVGEAISTPSQYTGYVLADGQTIGAATVKTGRPNKDTNLAAVQITLDIYGKKTTLKTNIYSAENATAMFVTKSGDRGIITLIGKDCVTGWLDDGTEFVAYKDPWSIGDSETVELAERLEGIWSLVVSGEFYETSGCVPCGSYKETQGDRVFFTVNVGAKGKAKVTGTMAAGKKVSFSSQLVAAGNTVIIPIIDYKKLGSGFVLEFDNNNKATIVHPASKEQLIAIGISASTLEDPLYFSVSDGTAVQLENNKNKLTAESISLTLSYAPTTGICKGSYKDKVNNRSVTVNGVFVGAVGYLTAVPKGGDPMHASISSVVPHGFIPESEDCDDCKE